MPLEQPFTDSATPLLHSQILLPNPLPMHAFVGNEVYECLWTRVNRICDRYMVRAADVRWKIKGKQPQHNCEDRRLLLTRLPLSRSRTLFR